MMNCAVGDFISFQMAQMWSKGHVLQTELGPLMKFCIDQELDVDQDHH